MQQKTVYVKLENVIDIIQQIRKEHLEAQLKTTDRLKFAFESAKIGVLTDAHISIICDVERFTAEQVAAEDAEEAVNAEGVVSEIADVIEEMVADENLDHILVQGHDRKGWTDEEVAKGDDMMKRIADEIAWADKGHGDVRVYAKGTEGQTFTELRIEMRRVADVVAEIRRRVQ